MGAFNFLVLNLKSYISLFSQIFSRKKMPNGAKKGVSMYMGMNNLLFICFLWCFFFNVFLRKIPFRKMIALLCNYIKGKQKGKTFFYFSSYFKVCCFFCCKMGYWWAIKKKLVFYFKKGPEIQHLAYFIYLLRFRR